MYLKNELMELTEFLHAGTNSSKSKLNWKFLEWAWLKWAWPVWWGSSKSNCIWRRNRWNKLILCMLIQIHKIKCWSNIFWVGMVKNGCGQSGHGNLKLTVPQKWTNGINWFFSSWYKFRRAKSWFNDFGVDAVKNGHGLLILETLRMKLWIELIFWMLIVIQKFLVSLVSYSLTYKCQGSTAFVLLVYF